MRVRWRGNPLPISDVFPGIRFSEGVRVAEQVTGGSYAIFSLFLSIHPLCLSPADCLVVPASLLLLCLSQTERRSERKAAAPMD